jgi:hypothetical protein
MTMNAPSKSARQALSGIVDFPELSAGDLAALERLGPARVCSLLAQTSRGARLHITQGPYDKDACLWLDWKAARAALWVKAGVFLAFIAAVAGVLSAVEGWLALK